MTDLKKIIFEFVSNRSNQKESTTSRHVHRRFDISIDDAENILKEMLANNMIKEFYDEEYKENRYMKK